MFCFSFQLPVNLVFAKIQRLEFVLGVSNTSNSASNAIEITVKNKTNASPAGVNVIKLLHFDLLVGPLDLRAPANVQVTSVADVAELHV